MFSDIAPDRLGECGIFGRNLFAGNRPDVLSGELPPNALGIRARLLGDPETTEVRGEIPGERCLSRGLRPGDDDPGYAVAHHEGVGRGTTERRHSTSPMTASTRKAA
jgi:hypothetical protein